MKTKLQFLGALLLALFLSINAYATTQTVIVGPSNTLTFSPSHFTINLGDTVKWTWATGNHNTVSTTIPSGAASWNSGLHVSPFTYIYVPTVLGTYYSVCTPHAAAGMKDTFTVVCGASAPIPPLAAANGPTSFCTGGSVLINCISSSGLGYTYQWLLNNTIIGGATTNQYTATASGSYTCVVTHICVSDTSNAVVVTVVSPPASTFTIVPNTGICTGTNVTITYTGSGSGASTYSWNFGGGIISSGSGAGPYQVLWNSSGTMNVTLQVTTGSCSGGITTNTAEVVQATVVISHNHPIICPGNCDTLVATGCQTYTWMPGSTTGATYIRCDSAAVITVTGVDAAGCSDTDQAGVTVAALMNPSFTHSNTGSNFSFTGSGTGVTSWSWDFGDGSSSTQQSPSHTYSGAGNDTVILTVTNSLGCTETFTQVIQVPSSVNSLTDYSGIIVSPNPASSEITITVAGSNEINASVFDLNGKLLACKILPRFMLMCVGCPVSIGVDVSLLPAGIYLLQVKTEKTTKMLKLLIER